MLPHALQENDYVTNITPLVQDGKTIGYTLSFSKSDPVTIYHGKDGANGAPVKIFTCYEDTTVPYQRNAQLMYNMMKNAGMECELSLVHTDAATPHRYEQQD